MLKELQENPIFGTWVRFSPCNLVPNRSSSATKGDTTKEYVFPPHPHAQVTFTWNPLVDKWSTFVYLFQRVVMGPSTSIWTEFCFMGMGNGVGPKFYWIL